MRAPECILTKEAVTALLELIVSQERPIRIKRSEADADGIKEEWIIGSWFSSERCYLFRKDTEDQVEVTFSLGMMDAVERIVSSHSGCSWVYPNKKTRAEQVSHSERP